MSPEAIGMITTNSEPSAEPGGATESLGSPLANHSRRTPQPICLVCVPPPAIPILLGDYETHCSHYDAHASPCGRVREGDAHAERHNPLEVCRRATVEYTARPQEPKSTLTILKIEAHSKLGTIVHISVSDVVIPSPDSDTPRDSIGHMPIDAGILEFSVTELVRQSVPLPDFTEGYEIWREAFDQGQAGVFDLPVSECVGFMEEVLGK